MKIKWLLVLFVITVIISIIVFIKYKGYEGMFDSFKKEQIDTTKVEVIGEVIPITIEEPDTIYIYRVIVGSFDNYENAKSLSESLPFSDILESDNGMFRVSKSYYFNKEDAQIEKDSLGEDVWILKDSMIIK